MDFWADVFSSWDSFFTFVFVVVAFYGSFWVLDKIWNLVSGRGKKQGNNRSKLSGYTTRKSTSNGTIRTKVVGVTFDNRQNAIQRLRTGEKLELIQEPENPHDANAVRVETSAGEQIGYLDKELAKESQWWFVVSIFPRSANVVKIIGRQSRGESLGVVIEIHPPSKEEALGSSMYEYPPF